VGSLPITEPFPIRSDESIRKISRAEDVSSDARLFARDAALKARDQAIVAEHERAGAEGQDRVHLRRVSRHALELRIPHAGFGEEGNQAALAPVGGSDPAIAGFRGRPGFKGRSRNGRQSRIPRRPSQGSSMQHVHTPTHTPAAIAELLKKCKNLCQSAESALPLFTSERETFLSANLGDALAQLELVLRAVGQEPNETSRKEDRLSFVRKLFGRSQVDNEHPFEPPKFEVSRQGLQGNSATVPMAELLSFLAFGRKTGVLWVDTPGENFLIGLTEGTIRHAASDRTPEGLRLGEVLVGLGFLTRRQLERFVEQSGESNPSVFGETLVKNGMISAEELERALSHQVRQVVQRVMQSKIALFRFREELEVHLAHNVNLDVNQLLLDNARVLDETSNADIRQEAVEDRWNSWQYELSAEVSAATQGAVDNAPSIAPKAEFCPAADAELPADADADQAEKKSTEPS